LSPNSIALIYNSAISGWKPTHLTSGFSSRISVLTSPHGTTIQDYGCPYRDVRIC
jgi:hypothetical protein